MKKILLYLFLWLMALKGYGQSCLIIYDANNSNTSALVTALQNAGITVTLSSTAATGYIGTNPSPAGFDAVIHLNGTTGSIPTSGQNALVNYVQNLGGIFISGEWNTFQYGSGGLANMRDLLLFTNYSGYCGTTMTYTTVSGKSGHPLLAGMSSSFTMNTCGTNSPLFTFSSQPSEALMTDNNSRPAVAVRPFGTGQVVGFNFTTGTWGSSSVLTNTNVQQLYINAIRMARRNAALNFDGSNDRVSIPHQTYQIGMSELTLEAWVYITGTSGNFRNIIMKGNYGYGMAIDFNNKVGYWSDPSYSNCPTSNSAIPMNTWTHVAVVVRQGISTTFYINGVADGSSTSAGHTTINAGSNDPLFLGYQGTGCNCNYFSGSMDEVRIWNVARSASQISGGINCTQGRLTNLIANYDFNNGNPGATQTTRDTLSDISGNWNKGTLLNFALTGSTSNWSAPAIGHEIDITGNSVTIADGDVTPSTADSTDFGVVSFGTVRRYTIRNTGAATLNISGITVTGTNASEFVLSGAPTSVSPGGSAAFNITFNPTVAASVRTATITVNTNDCDESVYDFSIQGQTPSLPGASLHFSGWQNSGGGSNSNPSVHDFIQIPDNGTLDLDNNYTIEAWVYLDDNNNNTIIDKGNYRYLFQTHPNGRTGLGLYNPSMGWVYSSGTVPTGTWTHVAVTFDAIARSVSFYMNGNLLSTHSSGNAGPVASPGTDNGVINIGRQNPSSCVCNNFDGRMDELRIWTRTLCQGEIQARMNCEIPTTASGLAANYHFNQGVAGGSNGSTNTLTDASGNGNTGTLTNFALTGSTSNWISPGAVTSGSNCGAYNAPEINVRGNTISVLDGDVTPSLTDSTSFGRVASGTVRRFTIENTGSGVLNISSITVSGTNATEFSVTGVPTAIAANSSAVFNVRFTSTSGGLRTATININNSDCDEAVYNFNVSAELACSFASPLAASVATHTSAIAATTPGGWTCFCNASGELLLALKLGGTGAVIPAAGGVELKINSTSATWYPHSTGFVGNYSGWAGLSRTWEVYPSVQPSSDVPVRFYVSNSDITALNTTLSANGASPITSVSEMSFYKVTNGAKPAHSAVANLAQSDVKVYSNSTTVNGETPFTDSTYGGGKFHAQFSVSSFSGGGGGSGGLGLTPLPVELLSISANGINNSHIRVSWTTTRETNSDKFEVQRSEDGRNFTGIGAVNAAGFSETGKSYQFNDFSAAPGKLYYYRLAVHETDASVSHTRVVTGSLTELTSGQIAFSPNPASDELSVVWPAHTESARISITSLSGQVVFERDFSNLPPNRINLSLLSNGLYIIRFETDDKSFSSKLMIQK